MAPGLARRQARNKEEKTADRPHALTILIGLMSPMLSMVAVGISLVALDVNKQSMEVGQRAYLSIEMGTIRLDEPERIYTQEPGIRLGSHIGFEIRNAGRTPAYLSSVTLEFDFPREWELEPTLNRTIKSGQRVLSRDMNVTIGPDNVLRRDSIELLLVSERALKRPHPSWRS